MPETAQTVPFVGQSPAIDLRVSGGEMGNAAWAGSRNVFWSPTGAPTKRPGIHSIHTPFHLTSEISGSLGDFTVQAIHQFRRIENGGRTTTNIYLVVIDGHLIGSWHGRKYDIAIGSGIGDYPFVPSLIDVYSGAENRRYLVVTSTDPMVGPRFWNGVYDTDAGQWTSLQELSGAPIGSFGIEHNSRLWLADENRLIYSASGDFRDFANGGEFYVDPRWGEITGFFPTYYGSLLVGQENAILNVSFNAGSGLPESVLPLVTDVGLTNTKAVASLGSELVFLSTDGNLTTVSTTDRFGDLEVRALSAAFRDRIAAPTKESRPHVFLVNDHENTTIWIGHPDGSGVKNDLLTGWNYAANKPVFIESPSIGAPSCGAVMTMPSHGKRRFYFGNYSTASTDVSVTGAGRIWFFDPGTKEDRAVEIAFADSLDTSTTNDLGPLVWEGSYGTAKWPFTAAQLNATGTYYSSPFPEQATITLTIDVSGTVGTSPSIPVTCEVREHGSVPKVEVGTLLTNLGAAYTHVPFNIETATRDYGFDIQVPAGAVVAGQVIKILMDRGRKLSLTYSSGFPGKTDNLHFNQTALGPTLSYNYVPMVETHGMYFGDPKTSFRLVGATVLTSTVGEVADITNTISGASANKGQNPYRWMADFYLRADTDRDWKHYATLNGNASQARHLSASQSVAGGEYEERDSLQIVLDNTVADAHEICRRENVNVEYIPIGRTVKMFWCRMDQVAATCIDHESAPGDGKNVAGGTWIGDFKVLAIMFHIDPGPSSPMMHNLASTSVRHDPTPTV